MSERNLVLRSIESPDGRLCVDIFRRPDGQFGFAEFRRDPEDTSGWHPTGLGAVTPLASVDSALADACRRITWLANLLRT